MNVTKLIRGCIITALFATAFAFASTSSAQVIQAQGSQPLQPVPPVPPPTAIAIPGRARAVTLPPGAFNIALLGIDKRPDKSFLNTDVIMIASINPDVPAVTLLSIPRDTPAYIPGVGVQKVNTAYAAGGPDLFKETIRYNFGLDIQNYALLNFEGVVHAVDALGGVDVIATCPLQQTFPRDPYYMGGFVTAHDYKDTFSNDVWKAGTRIPLLTINIAKPGVYSFDGLTALAFVRARKGIPGGDVDRGRREQRMVRAILAKVRQAGSIDKLTALYNAVKGDVESDMTLESILRYGLMANKVGDAVIRSRYLTGNDGNGMAMEGAPTKQSASRVDWIEQALNVALNQRINDGIPIEVINGTGESGFALAAADRLKELGFVITYIRAADKPVKSTIIVDHNTTKKGSPVPLILRTFDLRQSAVQNDPRPDGPRFSITIGPDFNTCYFAGSLKASGSDPIQRNTPKNVPTPLEASVIVTDSAPIAQVLSDTAKDKSVITTATKLLTPTAQTQMEVSTNTLPLTPTSALTPTFFVPAGDLVNIRTAPTTRARPLGRLTGPYNGEILGRSVDGQWLQFFLPRVNRVGWIRSDVVQVRGYYEEQPAQAATPMPVAQTTAEVPHILVPRGDVVNVRNGPGTNFNVLGRMRSRQSAVITGKSTDGVWWQILFGKNPAWINSSVVRTAGNVGDVPVVQ